MNSQKNLWNNVYRIDAVNLNAPTNFAKEVIKLLNKTSRILELGCGLGYDSLFFAKLNHKTIASDFSTTVIEKNKKTNINTPNLNFQIIDISGHFPFENNSFDLVYARLSLHYFLDKTTREIFREIHRVLKPNALLCFMCKSTDDFLYGKGNEIENSVFENNGKVRHFFNEEYTRSCLKDLFVIEKLEKGNEIFYDNKKSSSYIKVIARTIKSIDNNTD